MKITETRLKEVILEEVYSRTLDDLIVEELFRVLFEQDESFDEDEIIAQYKRDTSFQHRVKNFFAGFDALPSIKKKAAIIALGILGAAGTNFAVDYATQVQASEIAQELRQDAREARAKYFGTAKDLSHFRDAATAEGPEPIDVNDIEGIQAVKDEFMSKGVEIAPIIGDAGLAISTGERQFLYTPADNISDDEYMPFVGMTKADWEALVRTWLTDQDGRDKLERFIGTKGRGQALFWAYGPRGKLFFDAFDDAPDGQQGMWLPPEWSVAYDVVQKNKARAGDSRQADDAGTSLRLNVTDLQESLKKYLHSLLGVL